MNTKAKLIVNLEELNRYIRFQVKVRSRVQGKTFVHRSKMIPCTVEMFNQNNHFPDETSQYYIGRKICPDMEHIKEFWKLKNGYSNQNERVSFNI